MRARIVTVVSLVSDDTGGIKLKDVLYSRLVDVLLNLETVAQLSKNNRVEL